MFKHYLKIALRNLKKYALQNTISILGLASGFVCLSLSTIWLYFENSFDTFHKDSDRIYAFSKYRSNGSEAHNDFFNFLIFPKLMEYPEIESYTKYEYVDDNLEAIALEAIELKVDSSFFSNFFELNIISGDNKFLKDYSYIAITPAFAKKMFPDEDPIGKSCFGKTVGAVIKDFGKNSIIQFDAISVYPFRFIPYGEFGPYFDLYPKVLIKVKKGIDIDTFAEKVRSSLSDEQKYEHYELLPIKEVHRQVAKNEMYVNYAHMKIFFVASTLLMVCAIFNFMLFSLNRIKKRQREMALRMVNGATEKSLVLLLTTEVAIILGMAMILGLLSVQFIQPYFIKLADVQMTKEFVTLGSLVMMLIVFLLSLSLCSLAVRTARRNTMQNSISHSNNDNFRKVSIGIQTFTSVLFIFIVCVMINQLNFLRNNDWGTKVNDIVVLSIPSPTASIRYGFGMNGAYYPSENENEVNYQRIDNRFDNTNVFYKRIDNQFGLTEKLKSIPAVTSFHFGIGDINKVIESAEDLSLHSNDMRYYTMVNGRDSMNVKVIDIAEPEKLALFEPTVIDGEIPNRPLQRDEIIVTEDFQKEFGLGSIDQEPTVTIERSYPIPNGSFNLNEPYEIGPGEVGFISYTFRVVAIIKDIYAYKFDAPSSRYMFILCSPGNRRIMPPVQIGWETAMVTLEYQHGMKKEVKEQISKIMGETGLDYRIEFTEDTFFSSLESQEHLKNLILTLGSICVFVAVFGIWSMITLTCQERRREIAVRKVHGAKVRDILQIFAREYGALLALVSVMAFGVGFIIMHHWQQQYERQAVISWWIYADIFVSMAIIICLTVVQRVLKTARENPADVIKSE